MYKSPYGEWQLADYVPMRAKRPQTEKQRLASILLGLQARMKSERDRFAMLAHTWLALDPVFLDTETTGLDAGAQALEIALMNARCERIFETRLKPTVGIDPAAAAVQV